MTYDNRQFYIDGGWVDPAQPKEFKVINPATEEVSGRHFHGKRQGRRSRGRRGPPRISTGFSADFAADRLAAACERILAAYKAHYDDSPKAIPTRWARP